jgi:hypothetical protein
VFTFLLALVAELRQVLPERAWYQGLTCLGITLSWERRHGVCLIALQIPFETQ